MGPVSQVNLNAPHPLLDTVSLKCFNPQETIPSTISFIDISCSRGDWVGQDPVIDASPLNWRLEYIREPIFIITGPDISQ